MPWNVLQSLQTVPSIPDLCLVDVCTYKFVCRWCRAHQTQIFVFLVLRCLRDTGSFDKRHFGPRSEVRPKTLRIWDTLDLSVSDIYSGLMVFLTKIKVNYLVTHKDLRLVVLENGLFAESVSFCRPIASIMKLIQIGLRYKIWEPTLNRNKWSIHFIQHCHYWVLTKWK